jgi:hypothetical protein
MKTENKQLETYCKNCVINEDEQRYSGQENIHLAVFNFKFKN